MREPHFPIWDYLNMTVPGESPRHIAPGIVRLSMFKLTIMLLLLGLMSLSGATILMIDSPTSELLLAAMLSKTWRIHHISGHAFVEFDLSAQEAKLVNRAPRDQIFVKLYDDQFPCPSYEDEDVMTWMLVVLPSKEAVRGRLNVETWLRDTNFRDHSEKSLARWLCERKPTDPFIAALVYAMSELSLEREGHSRAMEMIEICKVGPQEEDDNDDYQATPLRISESSPESIPILDEIKLDLSDEADETEETDV